MHYSDAVVLKSIDFELNYQGTSERHFEKSKMLNRGGQERRLLLKMDVLGSYSSFFHLNAENTTFIFPISLFLFSKGFASFYILFSRSI